MTANARSNSSQSGNWAVEAIDPQSYAKVFSTPGNIFEGSYLSENDTGKIFLGIGIAGADETKVRGYRGSLRIVHTGDRV